jgi:hypothetical protein
VAHLGTSSCCTKTAGRRISPARLRQHTMGGSAPVEHCGAEGRARGHKPPGALVCVAAGPVWAARRERARPLTEVELRAVLAQDCRHGGLCCPYGGEADARSAVVLLLGG